MRLPNVFCSISKLSGNRRKPYAVRKSAVSFNGKRKLLYLGIFETYDKAIQFLSNANANEVTRRRLLGHASNNVTDAVYTHKALPQLRQAIKLLR